MFIVDYPNRAENITNLNYLLSSQFLPHYVLYLKREYSLLTKVVFTSPSDRTDLDYFGS